MLAVIEDLLESWPGTLIVVSQDRYFLERVTDQQYAILGGRLRHLPGGVDEYLRLRLQAAPPAPPWGAGVPPARPGAAPASPKGQPAAGIAPGSAAERAAKKELDRL